MSAAALVSEMDGRRRRRPELKPLLGPGLIAQCDSVEFSSEVALVVVRSNLGL